MVITALLIYPELQACRDLTHFSERSRAACVNSWALFIYQLISNKHSWQIQYVHVFRLSFSNQ